MENVTWIEPRPEWSALADRIGASFKSVCLVPGWFGAGTNQHGVIFIGESLLEQLSYDEIEVVLAHELGHSVWLRTKAARWGLAAGLVITRCLSTRLGTLHPLLIYMCWLQIEAITAAMLFPVRWSREYGADTIAAQEFGVERVRSVLGKLQELRGTPDDPSADHPPFAFRMAYLAAM